MSYGAADYLLMFAANFAVVFLLGLQSRNVTAGRYVAAIVTSFGISVANFTFIKYAADGSLDAFAFCAAGGCVGIAASIWFYENVIQHGWNRRKNSGEPVRPDAAIPGFYGQIPTEVKK